MGVSKRFMAAGAVCLLLVSAVTYQFALYSSASKISLLETALKGKETELAGLVSPAKETAPGQSNETVNCLLCHDIGETKGFHVPQTIMRIDERSGKRRRICIDCHGPNAYDEKGSFLGWNADVQMTPLALITFDNTTGRNGVFKVSSTVPHAIHNRLLRELKTIDCLDCHLIGDEIKAPAPDVEKGQVLVCQNCKFHPEDGNYVKIHVEDGGKGCITCHTGNVIEIHRTKTFGLGQIG